MRDEIGRILLLVYHCSSNDCLVNVKVSILSLKLC